jgi:hypothetical protein
MKKRALSRSGDGLINVNAGGQNMKRASSGRGFKSGKQIAKEKKSEKENISYNNHPAQLSSLLPP